MIGQVTFDTIKTIWDNTLPPHDFEETFSNSEEVPKNLFEGIPSAEDTETFPRDLPDDLIKRYVGETKQQDKDEYKSEPGVVWELKSGLESASVQINERTLLQS